MAASLDRHSSSRRSSVACDAQVSSGDCAGADFAASENRRGFGWNICARSIDLTGWLPGSATCIAWSAEVSNHARSFDHGHQLGFGERGGSEAVLLAEGSEGFARRLDVVEHADEADEGR